MHSGHRVTPKPEQRGHLRGGRLLTKSPRRMRRRAQRAATDVTTAPVTNPPIAAPPSMRSRIGVLADILGIDAASEIRASLSLCISSAYVQKKVKKMERNHVRLRHVCDARFTVSVRFHMLSDFPMWYYNLLGDEPKSESGLVLCFTKWGNVSSSLLIG